MASYLERCSTKWNTTRFFLLRLKEHLPDTAQLSLELESELAHLIRMKCTACRVGAPRLTDADIAKFHRQVPGWEVKQRAGIKRLERDFPDFARALAFTNSVGKIAEAQGHHPAIVTEWGKVTVSWWTHKIKGLHVNDFIMAARTDKLYRRRG